MHDRSNAEPGAASPDYRERLSPSLWTLLSAAVAAPMTALVFAPIDATVSLLVGLLTAAALLAALVLLAPVVEVRGGELRVGRARIPVGYLGEAEPFTGDEARQLRGPALPRTAWHLLRGGIDGKVVARDPVGEWVFSSRTPDRVCAAIRRAQRAGVPTATR